MYILSDLGRLLRGCHGKLDVLAGLKRVWSRKWSASTLMLRGERQDQKSAQDDFISENLEMLLLATLSFTTPKLSSRCRKPSPNSRR